MYSLSTILSCHSHALLVEPTLNFQYKILTVSEALGLTFNTLTQFVLISVLKYHPFLGYGLASLASEFLKIIVIVVMTKRESQSANLDFNLKLKFVEIHGQKKYLTEEQVDLSSQIVKE